MNSRKSCLQFGVTLLFLGVTFFCLLTPSVAQDNYGPEELHRHFQKVAETYVMELGSKPLELRSRPILKWDNPEREDLHGALYAWQQKGRPCVLGSVFTYEYAGKTWCRHEMLSIAPGAVTASFEGEVVWSPEASGLIWQSIDDAPTPLGSEAQRLIQMRALARSFSGILRITDKPPSKLRLLPRPLVRYEATDERIIDGAVFALTVSTDAEILLLIEARQREDDSAEYVFAAAPGHYHELELRRGDTAVWSAPRKIELESTTAGQLPWAKQPFFIFTPSRPLPNATELR